KPASLDAPVREFCRIELDRLDGQIQLLRSVLWWYIAPCMVGVNAFFIGLAGFGIASVVYCIVTLLFARWLYALNMKALAMELVPRRNELASLLSQLDDGATSSSSLASPVSAELPRAARIFNVMAKLEAVNGPAEPAGAAVAKWFALGSLIFCLFVATAVPLARGAFDSGILIY